MWKTLFGKEADKLEHANDDERTYYVIEKEPLVNRFISVPKDKGNIYLINTSNLWAIFYIALLQMIHSVLHLVLQMKKWKKYAWHESPTPLFFQATTWKTTKFPSLSILAYGKIWLF